MSRTCWDQYCRPWQGERTRVKLHWYRCPPGARTLGFPTIFGLNQLWSDIPAEDPPVGVPGTLIRHRDYTKGRPPRLILLGVPPTGTPEVWANGGVRGVDPALTFRASGYSVECLAEQGKVEVDPLLGLLFAVNVTLESQVLPAGQGSLVIRLRGSGSGRIYVPTYVTGCYAQALLYLQGSGVASTTSTPDRKSVV